MKVSISNAAGGKSLPCGVDHMLQETGHSIIVMMGTLGPVFLGANPGSAAYSWHLLGKPPFYASLFPTCKMGIIPASIA